MCVLPCPACYPQERGEAEAWNSKLVVHAPVAGAVAVKVPLLNQNKKAVAMQAREAAAAVAAGTAPAPAAAKAPMKLSTGIQLMDPILAAKTRPSAKTTAAAQRRVTAATAAAAAAEAGVDVEPAVELPAPLLQPYHPLIQKLMRGLDLLEPTPVQRRCWPPACSGKDLQAVAEPGSGKTLAYLLPGYVKCQVSYRLLQSRH